MITCSVVSPQCPWLCDCIFLECISCTLCRNRSGRMVNTCYFKTPYFCCGCQGQSTMFMNQYFIGSGGAAILLVCFDNKGKASGVRYLTLGRDLPHCMFRRQDFSLILHKVYKGLRYLQTSLLLYINGADPLR